MEHLVHIETKLVRNTPAGGNKMRLSKKKLNFTSITEISDLNNALN